MSLPSVEHFLPFRVSELVDWLCTDQDQTTATEFRSFARAVGRAVHASYFAELQEIKNDYAPFDPDADTRNLHQFSPEERARLLDRLFANIQFLLERANYIRLDRAAIEKEMAGASDWGVDMNVCWDAFERIDVYVRGIGMGTRTRAQRWRPWRTESVEVPTFRRVVLAFKQAPHPSLGPDPDVKHVLLKSFKDIPRMDIEMLLPGTGLKMPWKTRLKLGGSGVGSIGYVAWKFGGTTAKTVTAVASGTTSMIGLMTLYTPLTMLLGYSYSTYSGYQTARQTYNLQLVRSLYYQNLDSSIGVLLRMTDEAEEQDTREILLAFTFLSRFAGSEGMTQADLDQKIEKALTEWTGLSLDFEVDDALRTLLRFGLVRETDGRYTAIPISEAMTRLCKPPSTEADP